MDNLRGILAIFSLIGIGIGCWWERPSLGLIVPSSIVLAMLTYSEIRGDSAENPEKATN